MQYGFVQMGVEFLLIKIPHPSEQTHIASILSGVDAVNIVLSVIKTQIRATMFLILFVIMYQHEHYNTKNNL